VSPRGSLDSTAAQEVLRKLRERMVAFAASRMQRDAAEDLAQDVLILLHEKYPGVDRVEELLPLAMKILRFKMMAGRRKAQRRGEYTQVPVDELQIADGGLNPEADAERRETRERLIAALGQLGERCRRLFALKLEGKTFPEIQGILGAASINTIYTWDLRCRKQLLERMGGREEGR
jgi:RNA polymerase sigma-70 factor (ECF subfamily)